MVMKMEKFTSSFDFDYQVDAKRDVNCLKLMPGLNYLASGLDNGQIKIWNTNGIN